MNAFLGTLIYLSSVEKFPVSVAPLLAMVVFFMAQKYLIEGYSASGVKGLSDGSPAGAQS